MGDSARLIAGLCTTAALATACATPPLSYVTQWLRKPGHHNKTMPNAVAEEYDCEKRRLPFFKVEKHELFPEKLSPGGKLSHRLIYVLCPATPTGVVRGILRTEVLFEGRAIVSDAVQHKLRPGRWVLDSIVSLPESAAPGIYAMDVRFESRKGNLKARLPFLVR